MKIKPPLRMLSYIQIVVAVAMLVPMFLAIGFGEMQSFSAFAITITLDLLISLLIIAYTQNEKDTPLIHKHGALVVAFSWIIATAIGALPLVLSGNVARYDQAYFEIMSGFTTTGATTLTNIEALDKSILFWRSESNWLGGMGIVVLFVALLPLFGSSGNSLVNAETVGPYKTKLTPKMKTTAFILWSIYVAFSVLEAIFLLIGGLDLYEAVTVTFSTMAAAGFCVKNSSIGAFNSLYVDIVVVTFMIISGTNFGLYFKLIEKKKLQFIKDPESKFYFAIIIIATTVCTFSLYTNGFFATIGTSIRYSIFQVVSILTTTGFATYDYTSWPFLAQAMLFSLMFIGGCSGSAGGGMKVIRILTLLKKPFYSIKQQLYPTGVFPLKLGKDTITDRQYVSISSFVTLYLSIIGISTIILASFPGIDVFSSLAASLLCLGNIGIGFGIFSPVGNFHLFSPFYTWWLAFLMLLGRLELYTVLVLFHKKFWGKR